MKNNKKTKELDLISKKIPKLFNNLKEMNFLIDEKIDARFATITEEIKEYLVSTKQEFDLLDEKEQIKNKAIEKINSRKSEIFICLNKFFDELWNIVSGMNKHEYRVHQLFAQKELFPLLATPPLNTRIYQKPLGYAGDFQTINYYYEDAYEGESSYEILLHRYSIELDVSRAHINRKPYLKKKIDETIKRTTDPINITSFGCGPAIEISEYTIENNINKRVIFNLLDSEKLALQYAKSKMLFAKDNPNVTTNYINMDIMGLIKRTRAHADLNGQNLLYAAGLFDYFKDRVAKAMINAMYELLSANGELVVVNVSKDHGARAYMELLGEWYLNLRNEEDLMALSKDIIDAKDKHIEKDPENGKNLYLVIRK